MKLNFSSLLLHFFNFQSKKYRKEIDRAAECVEKSAKGERHELRYFDFHPALAIHRVRRMDGGAQKQ
jgi:hypothetical protein